MIKVIIADDHKIVLEGLVSLISPNNDIVIIGEANNGNEVLQILEKKETDVVVLDIDMPEMDGIEATKIIRKRYPKVKILILTMHSTIGFVRKIVETGANGYILKNKGKEELVSAIKALHAGGEYFGQDITKILISSLKQSNMAGEIKLTRREIEVLKLIADEFTTPMISEKLHIAPTTVETHRRNLIEKTGVATTNGLVRFAVENGYTS